MTKKQQLTFTFENPNTAKEFEALLKQAVIEKLLACKRENACQSKRDPQDSARTALECPSIGVYRSGA